MMPSNFDTWTPGLAAYECAAHGLNAKQPLGALLLRVGGSSIEPMSLSCGFFSRSVPLGLGAGEGGVHDH